MGATKDTRYLEQHHGSWRVVVGWRVDGKVVKARRSLGTSSLREAQRRRWAVVAELKASPPSVHPIDDPETWKADLAAGDGGPDDDTPSVLSDHLERLEAKHGTASTPRSSLIEPMAGQRPSITTSAPS
jgi:hypothetical protein